MRHTWVNCVTFHTEKIKKRLIKNVKGKYFEAFFASLSMLQKYISLCLCLCRVFTKPLRIYATSPYFAVFFALKSQTKCYYLISLPKNNCSKKPIFITILCCSPLFMVVVVQKKPVLQLKMGETCQLPQTTCKIVRFCLYIAQKKKKITCQFSFTDIQQ